MLKISILFALLSFVIPHKSYAGEKSLYDFLWLDPDKKVYVLQNKIYKKEHTFYGDVGYLSNFTSKFQDTSGFKANAGFFIHEDWGIELFYNLYTNNDNDDWTNVRAINQADPFVRRFKSSMGAMAIWSPFYGKINTFNQIYYFDLSFGLGFAKVDAESNRLTVAPLNSTSSYDAESYNALVWKTNVKFHIRENIHLGVEWLQHHYSAPGPNQDGKEAADKLRMNQDLVVSIGFSY